jgi:sn-glycerol 3-phosphate transport system substrate-binding protein
MASITVCADRRNRMHAIAPVTRAARSSWPLVLALAFMSASVGISAIPAAARSDAKCPVAALRGATKPVDITFWHGEISTNEDVLEQLIAQFESSQDQVQVKLVNQVTYRDVLNKYRAGLTTGDLPDLVAMGAGADQTLVDSRSVVPVDACIQAANYPLADFVPRAIATHTIRDVQWSMPWTVPTPLLLYDKNAFRAAGLDPDRPPRTLDDVTDYSRRVVETHAARHGISLMRTSSLNAVLYTKSGQLYVNHQNGRTGRATKTLLDNKTGRRIWKWWDDIVDSGLAIDVGSEGTTDHLLAVGTGDAAMTIDWSYVLGPVFNVLASGEFSRVDLGVAPLPALGAGGGVPVGGGSLWIPRASSPLKRAAAWELIKFLSAPAQQAAYTVGTRGGYVPIRQSASQEPALQQMWRDNPETRVAYDQLISGPSDAIAAGPVLGDPTGVGDAVVDALTRMLAGDLSPKSALRQAQREADAALADYNERVGR